MIVRKFLYVILVQLMLQGGYSLNATQITALNTTKPQILKVSTEASVLNITTTIRTLNSTQPIHRANGTLNSTQPIHQAEETLNNTQLIHRANGTSARNTSLGEPPPKGKNLTGIFHSSFNTTIHQLNGNITRGVQTLNETLKTNYSTVAEAIASPEQAPPFRLQKSAAIASGVFLVSAVIGYLSCVGYRRYLQRKYGESQMLQGEDVYDTSDLRYFAI